MAAREKTRDELDMKTLRELATLPSNKYCFDCGQRGPTYVNVTIGAFVCSACGGLLRGLNPPHRVKSLTVCSFTEVEMDRIKSRGNEYCIHIWLGKYDSKSSEMDLSTPDKRREFMRLKYEEKKFYVDPREAIKKMKPRAPAVPSSTSPSVTQSKSHTVIQNKDASLLQKSGALSQTFSAGDVLNNTSSDLFTDFENDPFKDTKQGESKTDGASFADFSSAFGNAESKAASTSSGQTQNSPSVSSSSVTSSSASGMHTTTSHKKPAPPPPDRYAALADLDNQLHQQVASEMPVSNPSTNTTSTSASMFWPPTTLPASAAVFTPGPPNPFNSSPWTPQTVCTQNPFQGVPQSIPAGLNKPTISQQTSTLSSVKPSLPNGNVNASFWSPVPNQTWTNQFQNGQSDAFQNKAPVVDCNPWSRSFGVVTGANPFMNGSFSSGQPSNVARTNAGKNPFL